MSAPEHVASIPPPTTSHAQVITNRLLLSLPAEDYQRLTPHIRVIPMTPRRVLQKQDEPIREVYFPGGGACSLFKIMQDGKTAEIATIGDEGVISAGVFFGQRESVGEVVVQVPGAAALALAVDVFNAEMSRRGALYNRVVRFNQSLTSQIMQTTACNGLHSVEQRCCRLLLMTQDRVRRDEFPLTHEFVATMLGVRRPTVTLVAHALQQAGLITCRRGHITIVNRKKLEAAACECYESVRNTFRRLIPEVGGAS
jgi:CRP-like cAMP-binding protein